MGINRKGHAVNHTIKISNKILGDGHPCFVIVEAGSNHDGKFEQAKKLIDIAVGAQADAVKFQLFKAEFLYSPGDAAFSIVKENELPRDWLKELNSYAQKKGIIFMATPFDNEAIDLLVKIKCPAIKIASSEVTNLPLVHYAALQQLPILLSTGMSNLADIYEALEVIRRAGNDSVALMQCSAVYPANAEDVLLRNMDTLKNAFSLPVGFSDHTLGILMPPVAVARGACVVEKHFTLDKRLPGPDHSYAIEPDELAQMVKDIRTVEKSLGSLQKAMLPQERKFGRREGLYAARDIARNAEFAQDMIMSQRPAVGIDARFLKFVIGRRTKRNFKTGEPIHWGDFLNDK